MFEDLKLQKNTDELWLEFGVFEGKTINYISKFTTDKVYGFDSFEGLPEKWTDQFDKGAFKVSELPKVNDNVVLVKGWFDETLPTFIQEQNGKKVSFLHMDADYGFLRVDKIKE